MRHTLSPANVPLVRRQNRATVLRAILGYAPLSRREIALRTGLTPSTITSIIGELEGAGVVREIGPLTLDPAHRRAGRREILMDFDARSGLAVGVAIGVRRTLVTLGDLRANILARTEMLTEADRGSRDLARRLAAPIRQLIADVDGARDRVIGVGVSTIGLIDSEAGVIQFSPELGWSDEPFRELLEQSVGLPALVESNHRAVALAEVMFGLGQSVRNFMVVHAGSAISAGIVIGQRLYRGEWAGDGQLGHAVVPGVQDLCECGRTGCLNAVASQDAIERRAAQIARRAPHSRLAQILAETADVVPARQVYAAASAGDRAALDVVHGAGQYLGQAIAGLATVLDLDLVILSGLVVDVCPTFLDVVRAETQAHAFHAPGVVTRVVATSFGADSTLVGGLALVLHDMFYSPSQLPGRPEAVS